MKKTSNHLRSLVLIVAIMGVTWSCQEVEEATPITGESPPLSEVDKQRMTQLGKKLENPYSIANMKRALEGLNASNPSGRTASVGIEIETTDYYVRFFPRTDAELQRLEADSLPLYDYPLDHEIDSLGDYYIDPEVDPKEGKWFYTSVPVDYQFPNVQYEILEDLFLMDDLHEDSTVARGRTEGNSDLLEKLEYEALRITENLTKEERETNSKARCWVFCGQPPKKYPTGYVKVYDTEKRRLVGVDRVRVRTRRWFSYGYAYTNSSGYYRVNRDYRRPVHYTVFFQNWNGFKIRASTVSIWKAKHHVGQHSRDGYNINMYTNSRAWRFSTVNNAVVKYLRYCTQLGVGLPPRDLRIVASDRRGNGAAAPMLKHIWGAPGSVSRQAVLLFLARVAGLPQAILGDTFFRFVLPDVIIKANSSKGTARVYETTFHELAHASHYRKVGNNYWIKYIKYIITYGAYGNGTGKNAGLCALGEAWAYHMGYRLTLNEFGNTNTRVKLSAFENFAPLETGNRDDDIRVPNSLFSFWSGWIPAGIMHDITDTDRDWVRTGFRDEVSGYTHRDLYDALDRDVDTPQEFRDRLLRENSNRDQIDLRNLFEAYYWE